MRLQVISTHTGIIYCATNRVNGKRYVGKTTKGLPHRRRGHLASYECGDHTTVFYRALRKYGDAAFDWHVLARVSVDRLNSAEVAFIAALRTKMPRGYNMTDGGDGGATITGRHRSEATRRAIGDAQRGRNKGRTFEEIHGPERAAEIKAKAGSKLRGKKVSDETRRKLSDANSRRNTPEYRARISARLMGHAVSESARKKMSASQKKRKHPPHTEETKVKIGRGRRGKMHTEETKARIRAHFAGKKLEDRFCPEKVAEIKAKYQARPVNFKGCQHSEETKAKMRAAWELRKQRLAQQKKGGQGDAVAGHQHTPM